MVIYRITKQRYKNILSGKGAEIYGGRWNSIGTPALYTSENRALSVLELLVHTPKGILPPKYTILTLNVPAKFEDQIISIPRNKLPKNWNALQPEVESMEIGDKYFTEFKTLGIIVPSTIIKGENNIILNPIHVSFNEITITTKLEVELDERLLK